MSIDPRAYDFSKLWLATGGWTHELDIQRLAALVEDLCCDFEQELRESYDREQPH